ncbi:HAMP domain-containing sensor histidine kinase [Allohahella marinimesophila]|uniref:histidine kinase n=1 Tax=Allohahella marinimesophila TaxID=1054972 RepID=A0ABP7NLK7_9GAMM
MRLHNFISANMEAIILEWEAFARAIQPSGGDMDVMELRDHAQDMLLVIIDDMSTNQTERQRTRKSKGQSPGSNIETAAETHAEGRLLSGFSVILLVAEYRALRASVLRLWFQEPRSREQEGLEDVIRFNEAIDQALAESISRYSDAVIKNSDIFLGMLGHDLRAPLQSISFGAESLKLTKNIDASHVQIGTRILGSVHRLKGMLDNLMDFTQSRIGGGLSIHPVPMDLPAIVSRVVEEFRGSHPGHVFRELHTGDCRGEWDPGRLGQICQNLIGNAIHHGAPKGEILVCCSERAETVELSVHNAGDPIPTKDHKRIFDLAESTMSGRYNPDKNMGLGLYIVRELVQAHHGMVSLTSTSEDGTTFLIELPKTDTEASS